VRSIARAHRRKSVRPCRASARYGGVRRRPDQLGEPGLDVEVDVFVRFAEHKGAGLDLGADFP
jgi:hypothetical protein